MLMAFGKEWKLGFCQFLHRNLLEQDKKSIFAIGLIMGLLPCVPLLTLLSYIGLISKSWQDSILYSLTFGLGTALSPLILLVVLSGAISRLFTGKKQLYSQIFRLLCGLIIIFLGLQLIRRAF
jgi:thiol:disulfide interchange protein DsbD